MNLPSSQNFEIAEETIENPDSEYSDDDKKSPGADNVTDFEYLGRSLDVSHFHELSRQGKNPV